MNCSVTDGISSNENAQCVCLRCFESYIEENKLLAEQMAVCYEEKMSQNMIEIGEALYNTLQSDWRVFFEKTGAEIEKMKRIAMIQQQIMKMVNNALKKSG